MITKTVRAGYDSWVEADRPKKPHPKAPQLLLRAGEQEAFVFAKNPAPRGAIVVEATLRLRADGSSSGARTLTARRAAKKWKPKTLHWDNKPGVFGSSQPTASVGALSNGDPIDFAVTAHLNGSRHLGWRITTNAGNSHAVHSFNSSRFKPVLIVKYTWRPDAPTNLTSSDGAISIAKPVLRFSFNDVSGKIALESVQVQIDAAADGASPDWDSGELDADVPEVDLAQTSYPGLANGATTKWRVRVKSVDGYWSDWSDWVSMARVVKGVLAITSPAASPLNIVTEPTPTIIWTFTDQKRFQVIITAADDQRKILHDSDWVNSADNAYSIPAGVIRRTGTDYVVTVRGRDTVARVATGGDPAYSEATRTFRYEHDNTQDPVDWLTVEQVAREPRTRLRFFRADGAPDSWTIERNDRVVAAGIAPEELVLVAPNTWEYDDWTAPAYTDLTYEVVPVVNGAAAAGGPQEQVKVRIGGLWVTEPVNGWRFNLLEVGDPFGYGETDEVTSRAQGISRKVTSVRGLEDESIRGVLISSEEDPRPLAEQLADVWAIKERPTLRYRVSVADVNFPAEVGRVSPAPSSQFLEGIEQRAMTLAAWQDGELPFTVQA